MKKTINGKVYDTHKAVMITCRTTGVMGENEYLSESLYKTPRSGHYFLAGESGPWGIYAKYTGNNIYTSGTGVRPLTEDQARDWLKCATDHDMEPTS